MSITRIPACTVSYCPAPTSPEWHRCWVCGALATEHHHLKPRGMGGSKKRLVSRGVSEPPRLVAFYVADSAQRFEIADRVCAVCKEPLADRYHMMNDDLLTALAYAASIFVSLQRGTPIDEPLSVIERRSGSWADGGVFTSPLVVTTGRTIRVSSQPVGGQRNALAAATAADGLAGALRNSRTGKRTEPPTHDIGGRGAGGQKELATGLASPPGQGALPPKGGALNGAESPPAVARTWPVAAICCSECTTAALAIEFNHYYSIPPSSKDNIIALCHSHHEMVTTGGWGCSINHVPGRGLVFWAWDLHGETKAERVLEAESSAVEAGSGSPRPTTHGTQVVPLAAPPPASKAEGAAAEAGMVKVRDGQSAGSVQATGPAALNADVPEGLNVSAAAPSALVIPGTMTETSLTLPQNLSFEDWTDGITQLSVFAHHYQFHLGDAALYGENRWEEAWQTLTSLGLKKASLWNIMLVCQAIPPEARHPKLNFSHHVVVYKLDPEERDKWLDVAEASGWGVREFRENVQGKPSRKKRWSLEELRELAREHWELVKDGPNAREAEAGMQFLDWLEEQGE